MAFTKGGMRRLVLARLARDQSGRFGGSTAGSIRVMVRPPWPLWSCMARQVGAGSPDPDAPEPALMPFAPGPDLVTEVQLWVEAQGSLAQLAGRSQSERNAFMEGRSAREGLAWDAPSATGVQVVAFERRRVDGVAINAVTYCGSVRDVTETGAATEFVLRSDAGFTTIAGALFGRQAPIDRLGALAGLFQFRLGADES